MQRVKCYIKITCGNAVSDDSSTFSGLRSQCTICLECKCFKATNIWKKKHKRAMLRALNCTPEMIQ